MKLIREHKIYISFFFGISMLFSGLLSASGIPIGDSQSTAIQNEARRLTDKQLISSRKDDNHSALSSGLWHKIAVTENGIYKIDQNFFKSAKIDISDIDPRKIKIFGNGGKVLPQPNSTPRPTDLIENAIVVNGEADGKFDASDYILFYGQSPHTLSYNQGGFNYQNNIYSDTTFYFLSLDGDTGLRVKPQENAGTNFSILNEYDDCLVHERDLENLLFRKGNGSGREWFGEVFNSKNYQEFSFSVPGVVSGSPVSVTISTLSYNSYGNSSFSTKINGSKVGDQSFIPVRRGDYEVQGIVKTDTFKTSFAGNSSEVLVGLEFTKSSNYESHGLLNFITLQTRRKMQLNGKSTIFRASPAQPTTYEISQFTTDAEIWDITNAYEPKLQKADLAGSVAKFGITNEGYNEFIVFRPSQSSLPVYKGLVNNQDLRGSPSAEMIIITHPNFKTEAERLADFRRSNDNLQVQVVSTTEVFNEFASGSPDVTAIRDYARYQYLRSEGSLKYLLLFGKASFDYKNRIVGNTNFVPTYQSRNSLHPVYSYPSDDYYGFMEEDEGEWKETFDATGDHTLDIGIGRLPVTTLAEAKGVVDKLIHYSTSPQTLGKWRNDILFVADDGDNNTHQRHAERFAGFIDTAYTQFVVNKLYTDAYPQIPQPDGEVSEKGAEVLNDYIKKGCLIINYTGHGSDEGWNEENIFPIEMIKKWKNMDKLPFIVTATCEFGRHDSPLKISGAEKLVIKNDGGAIAMVTTARPVYSNTNFELNRAFYNSVFKKVDGKYQTIGEIIRQTKNNSLSGSVNRNFTLLGDPSLTLAYPKENIIINSVNSKPISEEADTLRALTEVTIHGSIVSTDSQILSQYKGTLYLDVYDKEAQIETLGDEDTPMEFSVRNILFRGKASVEDGQFEMQFFLPKNISYLVKNGRINMYATSNGSNNDANGCETKILIGGSNPSPAADNTGPQITPYINDTTFINGGISISSPILIAKLDDEHGINISGNSIGQEIKAVLDNEKEFILNDFYLSEENNYTKGWVNFPLGELPSGEHTINIMAWDSYNNPGEANINFRIGDNGKIELLNVTNFPNPVEEQTTFRFEHNRQGEDLDVELIIFSVNGEEVETFKSLISSSFSIAEAGKWNGEASNGAKLKEGIYIYRLKVRSLSDGARGEATKRLIIK